MEKKGKRLNVLPASVCWWFNFKFDLFVGTINRLFKSRDNFFELINPFTLSSKWQNYKEAMSQHPLILCCNESAQEFGQFR